MAAPRRFRLERLLELKAKKEQALAIQLGSAEAAARAAKAEQDALAAMRESGAGDLSAEGSRRVGDLRPLVELLDRLDDRLDAQLTHVRNAEKTVDEAQRLLAVAHQERRVLDRLREKHAERVRTSDAQTDQKTMDDVAVARFLRSRPSEL